MKYTGMFSESLRNGPACRSDKYGKKGALSDLEMYGSGCRTTSHHMLVKEPQEQKRVSFVDSAYSKDDLTRAQSYLNGQQERDR